MTVRQQWDLNVGALYLRIADDRRVDRTVGVTECANVDLSGTGDVLGIEVLSPGSYWPLAEILCRFTSIDEGTAHQLMVGYPFTPPVVEEAVATGGSWKNRELHVPLEDD